MAIRFVLESEQLGDLSIIRDLGSEKIQSIAEAITGLEPAAFRPSDLLRAISKVLPEDSREANIVLKQIMSLYTLKRQRELSVDDLLDGLQYGIGTSKDWNQEQILQWMTLRPDLRVLFSLSAIEMVIKILDLSYDYTNILRNIKILTDIRPLFNEEADSIEGAIVSYTLRLYFDSLAGSKSLSIALDERDVNKLLQTCQRALNKAKTSKEFLSTHGIERALICGEEEQ